MVLLLSQAEKILPFFLISVQLPPYDQEGLFKKALQAAQQNALGQQYMLRLHFKKKKNPL